MTAPGSGPVAPSTTTQPGAQVAAPRWQGSRRRSVIPALLVGLALGLALTACTPAPTLTGTPGSTLSSPEAPATGAAAADTPTPPAPSPTVDVSAALAALEQQYAARVGVSAIDSATGTTASYRGDERFGYASTLKVFAAAELLRLVPPADRDSVVTITQADLDAAGYSPVTSEHLADGMTLAQLAEAAVRQSDNTALNLVLDRLGGPSAFGQSFVRLRDTTTRVVNTEPALNTIEPGSTDDTTTPVSFTADLAAVAALGPSHSAMPSPPVLSAPDSELLVEWMTGNATGDELIRAGAPTGWVVADKSGGAGPVRNDIAIVAPPGRSPIILSVLTTKTDPAASYENALVAEVARVVLGALG